jgi:hypothetical protein
VRLTVAKWTIPANGPTSNGTTAIAGPGWFFISQNSFRLCRREGRIAPASDPAFSSLVGSVEWMDLRFTCDRGFRTDHRHPAERRAGRLDVRPVAWARTRRIEFQDFEFRRIRWLIRWLIIGWQLRPRATSGRASGVRHKSGETYASSTKRQESERTHTQGFWPLCGERTS